MTDATRRAMHVLEAHLDVYRQGQLAGVLEASAAAGNRLDTPAFIGCLLQDAGLDAWHLTALFDRESMPVDVARYGVPLGGFAFQLPHSLAPRPLREVFGAGWGDAVCETLRTRLHVDVALCVPVLHGETVRAVLVALMGVTDDAPLLASVLLHAATAASRFLNEARAPAAEEVLSPAGLTERATNELARAERYHRPVAVVVFELATHADLTNLAPSLLRSLRLWDVLGRWDSHTPTLVTVLPETNRNGVRGLLRRLGGRLGSVQVGAAVFPEDASGWLALVEFARGRTTRASTLLDDNSNLMRVGAVWTRGALAGPGGVVVRCPVCLVPYSHQPRHTGASLADDALDKARAMLRVGCPRHLDRFVV